MSTTGMLCRQIRSGPKRQQGLTVSELQALRVGFVPGGDALLMLDRLPLDAGIDGVELTLEQQDRGLTRTENFAQKQEAPKPQSPSASL